MDLLALLLHNVFCEGKKRLVMGESRPLRRLRPRRAGAGVRGSLAGCYGWREGRASTARSSSSSGQTPFDGGR